MRLENWSICTHPNDVYIAPEFRLPCLQGNVFNDPRGRSDGKRIVTTLIINVEGDKVITESGSVYELGKPNPKYIEWCMANNHHVPTIREPIRFLERGVENNFAFGGYKITIIFTEANEI